MYTSNIKYVVVKIYEYTENGARTLTRKICWPIYIKINRWIMKFPSNNIRGVLYYIICMYSMSVQINTFPPCPIGPLNANMHHGMRQIIHVPKHVIIQIVKFIQLLLSTHRYSVVHVFFGTSDVSNCKQNERLDENVQEFEMAWRLSAASIYKSLQFLNTWVKIKRPTPSDAHRHAKVVH